MAGVISLVDGEVLDPNGQAVADMENAEHVLLHGGAIGCLAVDEAGIEHAIRVDRVICKHVVSERIELCQLT